MGKRFCQICGSCKFDSQNCCLVCGEEYQEMDIVMTTLNCDEKSKIEDIYEKVVESIVVIQSGESIGTGWCVSEGLIITNAHVIEKNYKDTILPVKGSLKNGDSFLMDIVYYSKDEDIALLKFRDISDSKFLKTLEICNEEIKVGASLFTIGHPRDHKYVPTEGIIKDLNFRLKNSQHTFKMIHTSLNLEEGNSGGPIFNLNGQVIGMAALSLGYLEDLNVFVDSEIGIKKELLGKYTKEGVCNGIGVSREAICDALIKYNNRG